MWDLVYNDHSSSAFMQHSHAAWSQLSVPYVTGCTTKPVKMGCGAASIHPTLYSLLLDGKNSSGKYRKKDVKENQRA